MKNLLYNAMSKITRELTSVKFYSLIASFVLFNQNIITQENFITLVATILGIRELSDIIQIIKKNNK